MARISRHGTESGACAFWIPVQSGGLKPIIETSGELAWIPTSAWRRDCELHDGADVIATLGWQRSYQAAALGSCATGIWEFRLEGFLFKQWVKIVPPAGEAAAVFHARPSFTGVLEYGDGRAFYWDSNFWLTKWIWTDEGGFELMRVSRALTLKAEGSVCIQPGYLERPEIPLLTLLGWYLLMLLSDVRPG